MTKETYQILRNNHKNLYDKFNEQVTKAAQEYHGGDISSQQEKFREIQANIGEEVQKLLPDESYSTIEEATQFVLEALSSYILMQSIVTVVNDVVRIARENPSPKVQNN